MSDATYRHSFEQSGVGMALLTADGRFELVNSALCDLLGYPREALLEKTFQDVTAADDRHRSAIAFEDLWSGRDDSFRMTQQCLHSDGHAIWGDLTVTTVRDEWGATEHILAQIIDITALTEANARNRALAENLQQLTEKLTGELAGAAAYLSLIMPHAMTGPVSISSCYLPARELGGDCFDYVWIDDDHLLVYLLDVSGHGLQPALLAVSIHNMLRSRSLPTETLLSPEQTLETLNNLFRMDSQSDLYFTIWYGIFQNSTGTLRYSSAGAPPALLLTEIGTGKQVRPVTLATPCPPIGVIADTPFTEDICTIATGGQLLIFSDGALELGTEGPPLRLGELINQVAQLAASPAWSLDQLVYQLQARTATGTFEDDCSLVLLTFE